MKNIAIISLLATITAAVPFAKRDIVWTTVTQEVVETTIVTTTIWVDPASPSVAITSSAAPPATTTESALPDQYFEHSSSSSSSSAITPSSASPAYIAASSPPPAPLPQSPPSSSSAAYVPSPPPANPAPTTSAAPTHAYVPPPAPTSVAPTTTSAAPATPAQGMGSVPVQSGAAPAVGVADTSICAPGSTCSGDITYYTVGQGACGITNDGSKENVIALPHEMMGPLSNSNPYCGKTVSIKYNGKVANAVVADKCGDCVSFYCCLARKNNPWLIRMCHLTARSFYRSVRGTLQVARRHGSRTYP
jgi:hypothetical protein